MVGIDKDLAVLANMDDSKSQLDLVIDSPVQIGFVVPATSGSWFKILIPDPKTDGGWTGMGLIVTGVLTHCTLV